MRVAQNLDLTKFNSYELKATCAKAFFPNSEQDLISIYGDNPHTNKIILGNGNNVILSKEYYPDDFIIFNGNFDRVKITDNIIEAEAGATLEQLSLQALKHKLSGLEIFYDIPSSVGGAVVMNAGASGEEIKDILVKARYLDLADMQIKEMRNQEIGFTYRNSFFQKNPDKIVLKAWIKLLLGTARDIKIKMEETKQKRWAKQPRELPNCGSVFKRPNGRFVGPMIDELGLKGYTIGGAKISEKHSGFIVNASDATGNDILKLIDVVKALVNAEFGINLEVEQRIIK